MPGVNVQSPVPSGTLDAGRLPEGGGALITGLEINTSAGDGPQTIKRSEGLRQLAALPPTVRAWYGGSGRINNMNFATFDCSSQTKQNTTWALHYCRSTHQHRTTAVHVIGYRARCHIVYDTFVRPLVLHWRS